LAGSGVAGVLVRARRGFENLRAGIGAALVGGAIMQPNRDFVVEGLIQIGPRNDFFLFVDGEMIGKLLTQRAGAAPRQGEYTKLGRARITVEWLDEESE
jgi:hypothetical protein